MSKKNYIADRVNFPSSGLDGVSFLPLDGHLEIGRYFWNFRVSAETYRIFPM